MKSRAQGQFHCSIFSGHVVRGFLVVASVAGEQDCCSSQAHLFPLLIHNLEPQSPVISPSFGEIIIVGGQCNGLLADTFLYGKSAIWGGASRKTAYYFYGFNTTTSKSSLVLISLGSRFTFCGIIQLRSNLERKVP